MAYRGPDMLVVLRADTGEEVAKAELDSVGQAAYLTTHPDRRHVLLDIGEGQEEARARKGRKSSERRLLLLALA